jgi:peptidoglycan/LPS O-acetylase OafA/YrhL
LRVSEDYIPTLDGWRAVAISLVLLSHSARSSATAEHLGFLGVALFFGISGYLICTKLLVERERSGTISLKRFYWRRAFRILPASLIYLGVIGLLGMLAIERVKGRDVASGIFLFSNYLSDKDWDVNHFWSLSMEEHFYLIWPVLLATLGNRYARRTALVCIAGIFLWRAWALNHFVLAGIPTLQRTDLRLDAFFAPCALAILLREPLWRERATRWLSPVVVVALVAALAVLRIPHISSPIFSSFRQLAQACILPLIIVSSVFRPATLFGRFLELSPVRWVGRVSYSIYLWQMPFFDRNGWLGSHAGPVWLKIAALLAAASLSYYLIERPLIRLGRKRESLVLPSSARVLSQPVGQRELQANPTADEPAA